MGEKEKEGYHRKPKGTKIKSHKGKDDVEAKIKSPRKKKTEGEEASQTTTKKTKSTSEAKEHEETTQTSPEKKTRLKSSKADTEGKKEKENKEGTKKKRSRREKNKKIAEENPEKPAEEVYSTKNKETQESIDRKKERREKLVADITGSAPAAGPTKAKEARVRARSVYVPSKAEGKSDIKVSRDDMQSMSGLGSFIETLPDVDHDDKHEKKKFGLFKK